MEQLLYHLWSSGKFHSADMRLTDGTPFEVIDAGLRNFNSGPDFFNAKISIANTMWAGNIEIHQSSSDWYRHNHHKDKNYDNVILNVVMKHDSEIYRTNGEKIQQFVLPVSKDIMDNYDFLVRERGDEIPCAFRLSELDAVTVTDWITSLSLERIIEKANRIRSIKDRYMGDWQQALFILLARNFGTGINSDPFERLARSIPYTFLLKHIDSPLQTEAFFMGQAGFLDYDDKLSFTEHPYYILLKREYKFLASKFRLVPIAMSNWHLFRLRPSAFPQIRIAALASFVQKNTDIVSAFLSAQGIDGLRSLFKVSLNPFWDTHYRFEDSSPERVKALGFATVDTIILNTVIPFLLSYGDFTGDDKLKEKALELAENIPPENNRIIRNWQEAGIYSKSCFDTQGLIQLQKEYCDKKKCLFCRFGIKLLSK